MNAKAETSLIDYFGHKGVKKVMLFGSHARGESTKRSDIDIIIIKETNERFIERYREFSDIYEIVNATVDMLIYTPDEWNTIIKRKSFQKILKDARLLYVDRKE